MPDHRDLYVLDEDTCWEHLSATHVVRVGVAIDGTVDVLPVNHVVLDRAVYWRSAAGTKLGVAAAEQRVAVEADEVDPTDRSGWSVVVHGTVRIVSDPELLERLHAQNREPWTAVDQRVVWVGVEPDDVSGRRVG